MATFPERVLTAVNAVLGAAGDAALGPLMALPPLASLLVISLLTAAVAVFVVSRTSDQKGMAGTRRGIYAALLEIRLFSDDPPAVLRAAGEIMVANARYLRLSLVPLAWMAIPLTLAVAQLHAFYGYAGLTPGVAALVAVDLRPNGRDNGASSTALALEVPRGITVDSTAVRLAGSDQVLWRIVPGATGSYTLMIRDGDRAVTKSLEVSASTARRSPRRAQPSGLVDRLRYPSETPLPDDSNIAAITIAYPEARLQVLGWRLHWVVPYLLLSTAWALVLARRFGISI